MKLEMKGLSFRYEKSSHAALADFNLTLESGQRLGLKAPSGRGKTTLCKLLAGYMEPQSGQVLLDGLPLRAYRGPCPVQLIWQHPEEAVDPLLPLGETLSEAGPPEARILNGLGIRSEWYARYPAELSGGELQRFCVARALGKHTRFLLCDEMTAMLDTVNQAELWRFVLSECAQRDIGLLAVSHSDALLARLVTRCMVL
ncbi:MAG: ATP-binding cassette domain-containing protein [Clostridia bacterium]|nr:ATP-binding cassette domain-containing protein [Clostridia bacterium]